eukprot:TRINITY_DN1996_c0_g1_i1.p1 TRINITY_DN1996_c0_g1~~TRINITY_DN1996_c0_g1_i1.p1  ORF type:complete len:271 (-),score=58.44 TRINITY_DN1996_c0_g1_i1:69-881(-)
MDSIRNSEPEKPSSASTSYSQVHPHVRGSSLPFSHPTLPASLLTLRWMVGWRCGKACAEIRDYHSAVAIAGALLLSSISRLSLSFKLPHETLDIFHKCLSLFDLNGKNKQMNRAEYRVAISEGLTPCIPFLGYLLNDLTMSNLGNPIYINKEPPPPVINFQRYSTFYKILQQQWLPFKQDGYVDHFFVVPRLSSYLNTHVTAAHTLTEDALEKLSDQLELRKTDPHYVAMTPKEMDSLAKEIKNVIETDNKLLKKAKKLGMKEIPLVPHV